MKKIQKQTKELKPGDLVLWGRWDIPLLVLNTEYKERFNDVVWKYLRGTIIDTSILDADYWVMIAINDDEED